jgi:hypothetical protein
MDALSIYAVVVWTGFHLVALMLAWATRLACGSRLESVMQLVFFAAMAGVGGAACVSRYLDVGAWTASSVVFVAMVLTAVVDFRRLGDPAHATTPTASC